MHNTEKKETIEITLEVKIKLEVNLDSKEFKQSFEDYKDSIDSTATEKRMIKQVAYSLYNSIDSGRLIEGVGKIGFGDHYRPDELYCGINLIDTDIEVSNYEKV